MNDLLQQLVGMGPGIGAAVSGNGNAFASFMDGWQRAQMRDQQQKRLTQQDAIAAQDRDRMIGRQEVQDARAAEDQEFQRNARNMSVAGTLGQAASGAESIPEGEAAIDTLFRVLSPQAQQTMAPARDAALSGVQRTVTGRQKKQVEAFVEAAVKTAHVADNPDADPELINLPEHIQRIVGKPSARLSELQQFAQLPVGKPQGKTRVPPASGSMEEFSDPNITPERKAQILADRKAYMQSDDRAPRVTVNTGANEGRVNSRIDRITNSFNTAPIVKEFNEVQAQHQTIAQIVNSQWSGPGDMSVVFAFMKALDPNSVVRETEYANAAKSETSLRVGPHGSTAR
jgi:hypothetical protein